MDAHRQGARFRGCVLNVPLDEGIWQSWLASQDSQDQDEMGCWESTCIAGESGTATHPQVRFLGSWAQVTIPAKGPHKPRGSRQLMGAQVGTQGSSRVCWMGASLLYPPQAWPGI